MQFLPPGPCRRSLDSEASRWYREELGANPSGGPIFPSSASRDFVRDWNSTHRHEPVVGTSTRATRSAFVDRPRRENLSPAWWNSIHTALRRQRPHGHAGLPAIARLRRATAGAIDSFRLAKLGATPRTSGAPLRALHALRLSPGPIYRDVAELVDATGREPVGGKPREGASPFVATIFRPAGVKARISTATAPKPRLFVGAIPTPGTIVPWLESVYTTASKSVARKGVWARIPPGRPISIAAWRNRRRASLRISCPFRAYGCNPRGGDHRRVVQREPPAL